VREGLTADFLIARVIRLLPAIWSLPWARLLSDALHSAGRAASWLPRSVPPFSVRCARGPTCQRRASARRTAARSSSCALR
jgi:hypothetical protein